jgi:hypothetical protein
MALIEYERLREDLLGWDSRSKPFVSNDRKIFSLSKKSLNVDQRAIASHAILPTRELLKCNLLAYVVGFAWYPSRKGDDENRNEVEDTPKAGFHKIDSRKKEIPNIFRRPVQSRYERFRYFLRGDVELTEKKTLYGNILSKVLKVEEHVAKGKKIVIFEGDSLGLKSSHEDKRIVETLTSNNYRGHIIR